MHEEARRTLSESECIRITSAVNWMIGYIEGTGREIPPVIYGALKPITEMARHQPTPEEVARDAR